MDEQSVLALGALTLAGSAMGLLLSFRSNPLLRGLNWMSAALITGSIAACTYIATIYHPDLRPLGDLLVLLAFVLCSRAIRICAAGGEGSSRLDIALLAMQLAAALLQWTWVLPYRAGDLAFSLMLAVALFRTAQASQRGAHGNLRTSGLFASVLLQLLIVPDLVRGIVGAADLLAGTGRASIVDTFTYGSFIVGGIALGFSLFSGTTTRLTDQLERAASTDPLTRVYNRRAFLDWCEKEWTRSATSGLPFSILLIDLDHFKRINDSFGHHTGDAVLCAIVEHIQNAVRGIDVLCRWGGEEFAVLLPNAPHEATRIVAERVRRNVHMLSTSPQVVHQGERLHLRLTVSIGAGTWTGPEDTIDAILRRADAALYLAKETGRDRIMLDQPESSHMQRPVPVPALT